MKSVISILLPVLFGAVVQFSGADDQSVVERCAVATGYERVRWSESGELKLVEMEARESESSYGAVESCIDTLLDEVETEKFVNSLGEQGEALLALLEKDRWTLTRAEYKSVKAFKKEVAETVKEKVRLSMINYVFDHENDVIFDKEQKTRFHLLEWIDEDDRDPPSRDVVCAGLEKGSDDYKWCMGENEGTSQYGGGCKNSLGNPCGQTEIDMGWKYPIKK